MNLLFDNYFIADACYISLVHENLNHCKNLFKAVVLLLVIYCFMYFPLFVGFCVCLCFVMHYFASIHLEEEEKAGCFAFIVLQMTCYCKRSVALPHGAVG